MIFALFYRCNTYIANYSTSTINPSNRAPLLLYKYLMRKCDQLPKGPKQHYKFQIKQSYKQYMHETDPKRIDEIIAAAYKDIEWIMKKIPLITSGCTIDIDKFWISALIYHDRPNLLNKKLSGIIQSYFYEFNTEKIKDVTEYLTRSAIIYEVQEENKLIAPGFPYHFEWLTSGHIRIAVNNFEDADTANAEWLVEKVFPKIISWASNELVDKSQVSLSSICLEKYVELYQKLKKKYGKAMTEIWPENTDPLKFVYEDVAIASYLICLWDQQNASKKPTFLDLGCGNGLLVHILSQEGYDGYGIDVRKRKIWDIYPSTTKLLTKTIFPSSSSLFPDTDWVIGNHSDELTPWIPVIAMRSSYKTNFFLLPCCSYEFSGVKYARINTSTSQYIDYLNYVQDICKICGFIIKKDKLRIPSTKNVCIVSYGRNYESNEFNLINERVTKFIESKFGTVNKRDEWVQNFKPRDHVEKVQNCTQLNRDLIKRIIQQVVAKILETPVSFNENNKIWNKGAELPLKKLYLG
ncbi:hypothetical protein MML48_5g00021167 [Holotrichia oblita]|uniref:Uncharacterized protein n=1 Tax=Holotrichia oblita TaxID=644536 RepID=A0ACB9T237_HOLOL|nr:hypothetical protein MML48_5g00021167 [Holotrichia oblita]